MLSILELLRMDQVRGNIRRQMFSLGRVPKYANKVTKSNLSKEGEENIKVHASLSRNKIPRPKKAKPWGSAKFATTRK